MRRLPRPICAGSIAGFLAALSLFSDRSRAATLYWDLNGSAANSGVTNLSTNPWSGSFWNPNADGTGATSLWLAGSTAAFSAGSDATGSYGITVGQTFDIGGLIFKDGSVTISGAGALNLATASAEFFVGSGLSSQLNVNLTGSAALRKTGTGTLRLGSATNTFNGPLTISAGAISVADLGALGTGNSVITVEGTTTRGQGGGSLVLGGDVLSGFNVDRTLFVSGGGIGGDASALTSMGNNTFSSVATGTAASTRIFSMGGTTTITGLVVGTGQTSGLTTQLNGPGHFVVSNVIVPGVVNSLLEKTGGGGMILTGDNLIDNEVRVSGGSLRIADGTGLPILSGNGGTLELRTDNVASYTARFIGRNSTVLFLDHAAGSNQGILNQTLTFADSTFANAGQTFTLNSRNGYGLTFALTGSTTTFTGDGNTAFSNALTGKLTFDGKMTTTLGNSRVFTIGGNGDAEATDSITFSGGFHTLAKSGTGTLKLDNDNSAYGNTNINGGTLIINKLTATGNGALTLGSSSTTGALSFLGTAGTGAGDTTGRVFVLNGAAGNGAILANQSGSAVTPLVLTSNIGVPFTGSGAKTLFLGGTAAVDNTIGGVISNSFQSTTGITKVGSGTWVLSPAVAGFFTGTEVVAGSATTLNNVAVGVTTIDLVAGSGAALSVGQYVQGTNVPAGAFITAINGDTITINLAPTVAITASTPLNFSALGKTATTSGTGAANSNVIPIANVASLGLVVGQSVTGPNVPVGAVITAINTGNNTISISNSIGTTAVASGAKLGFGQVTNFTGGVTVSGGTLKVQPTANSGLAADVINNTSTLTFAADALSSNQTAGGTFEYVGLSGVSNLEQLGTLNASAGANILKATAQGVGGTADLRFSGVNAFTTGGSVNIIPSAGGSVSLSAGGASIPNVRLYFNGADFAYYPGGAGAAFTFPTYGTSTGTNVVAAAGLTLNSHNLITSTSGTSGTVTQGVAGSINSLKMDGSRTLIANNVALTIPAILVNGGSATINATAPNGAITASNTDIAVRVNGLSDVLTINAPITNTTSTGLSKNGAGTLILGSASNAMLGTVTVNEGLLQLASGAVLGGNGVSLTVRQGATFDLNGVNAGTSGSTAGAINSLNGAGLITNNAAGTAVAGLRIGNSAGNGVFTGTIQNGATAPISVIKAGGGTQMLSGLNTYSGETVLAGGVLQATNLANLGQPSSIGTGNLVFAGGILQYIGSNSGTTSLALATQTPSISIDRLFTIGLPASAGNVTAAIDSSGSFGNIVAGRSQNNATLVFNNTAPVAFAGTGTRQLTLQGDSTGDNEIKMQLGNNGASAFNLVKSGAGVWILSNPGNSYTGSTAINGGILRAVDGVTLPTASNLTFGGGTFESRSNSFTRPLGTGAGAVQWTGSGGFSADESRLTVAIGGIANPTALTWGSGGFVPDASALLLGSAVTQADIEFKNAINLGSNTGARTVQVDDNGNTNLDFALLTGVISSGNANPVLTKTGAGTLYLTAANTYTGNTAITNGTIIVSDIGNVLSLNSQLGAGSGSVANVTQGAVIIGSGTTTTSLSYVGTGELTNRPIVMNGTANASIDASGSGPLIVTNLITAQSDGATATTAKNIILRGFSPDANEVRNVIKDHSGTAATSLTKTDSGTWILTAANNYTGTTSVSAGALGIGNNAALSTSVVTVTNASLFAAGGDRTITNNVLFAGNATEAVFGDNNLTIGNGSTSITYGNNSADTTLSNFMSPGKVLTLNGTVVNMDVNAARRLNINGTGDTVINANIIDQATNNRASALTYSGTGLLKLTGSNTYTGTTVVSNGALQGVAGSSFSPNSALQIAGGVFQTSGTIGGIGSLPLGTGPGQVAWTSNGGFAAAGNGAAGTNNLTVNFTSALPNNELAWGITPNFVPAANNLIFGSASADSTVFWMNPIDLNPVLNTSVTRTFTVNDNPNTGTDKVVLQGFLRQSNLSNGGTGTVSITKAGLGTLIIESAAMTGSNAFNGTISVTGGTLQLGTTTPASPLAGVGGSYNMTPSAPGTNLILNHISMLRAGDFTANAGTAAGGITVSGTSDSSILLNVAATAATRNYVINDNPLVADDAIFSVPLLNGPGGSGLVHLTKQGSGTLVFQGDNTLQGVTVLYKGTLVYDYSLSAAGKLSDLADLEPRGGAMVLRGNGSADVTETVGNLSPGSSNLGKQIAVPNDNPLGSNPNTFGLFTNNTTPSQGAQSSITLQPTNGHKLTLNFGGFIRNPGGGIVLLSTTGPDGKFTTTQPGALANGRLLAVNALLDGRWIAQDGIGNIVPHFGNAQTDPGNWDSVVTAELTGPVSGSGTLPTNRLSGLIISGTNTALAINNPSASLTLTNGALLVPTGTPASLIQITGGKIMTQLPYKSAQGADLLIENFGTGVLSISSNLGYSEAPQGNAQIITIAGTGITELSGQNSSVINYLNTTRVTGSVKIIGGATLRIGGDGLTSDAISDYLPVDFGSTGDVAGTLQLNGHSETIGGIVTPVSVNQGTNNAIIDLGSGGALTINQLAAVSFNGVITGSGSFTKQGNAAFTVSSVAGNNPLTFTGSTTVGGGLLALTGNLSDGLTAVNTITLRGGELQAEHNSGGLLTINKLSDTAVVKLDGTINQGLRITSNATGRFENVQRIDLVTGANTITVDSANATSQLTLRATQSATPALTRGSTFSTLLVKGDNLGGGLDGALNNTARILLGSGSTGLGLVGGNGSTQSTYPIVPWMLGSVADPVASVVGDSFVTYGTNGLRPLNTTSEYLFNSYASASNLSNLSLSATTSGAGKAINSLRFDASGGGLNLTVSSGTLTVNSGAVLATMGAAANTVTIANTSAFIAPGSTNELIFSVTSTNATPTGAKLIVQPTITGANVSVTKTGPGTLQLAGSNDFGGGLTVNQGVLEFTSPQASNGLGAGTGKIRLAGGTLRFNDNSAANLQNHDIELYGASSFYTVSGTGATGNALTRGSVIDVPSAALSMRGPSKDGGFVKTGVGTLNLTSPSTFTGSMAVLRGVVNISAGLSGASGLFIVPENITGDLTGIAAPATVNFDSASPLSVNQLIVGGVFTAASLLSGTGTLTVGSNANHPVVTIGNGSGDSFMAVGYHDEGAGNGATVSSVTKGLADFTKASAVNINVSRLFIGQNKVGGSGRVQGDLKLPSSPAAQNNITAGFVIIGDSPGPDSIANGAVVSTLDLGFGETFLKADSITVGGQNANGIVVLNGDSQIGRGTLHISGRSGQNSGANLFIGDNDDITNTEQDESFTKVDTTSGVIDANLNLLVIGRHGGNTSHTATTGGGGGQLLFKDGVVNAATVQLGMTGTRVTTSNPDTTLDPHPEKTIANIAQDGGIFRFGEMSKGGGLVSYNWSAGTIENYGGRDSVNLNVTIAATQSLSDQRFISVPDAQRKMIFEAGAGFSDLGTLTKTGAGTLELRGSSAGYGGFWEHQAGRILVNNTSGDSGTGVGGINVYPGAELGGAGYVGGSVRLLSGLTPSSAGGKISAGSDASTIGTLTLLENTTLFAEAGSIIHLKIASSGPVLLGDKIKIGGFLDIDADPLGFQTNPDGDFNTTAILDLTDISPAHITSGAITLMTYSQGWTGGTGGGFDAGGYFKTPGGAIIYDYDPNNPGGTNPFYISGNAYQLDYNGGPSQSDVILIAVPEPGALASLIGGVGMLLGLQRFRRK